MRQIIFVFVAATLFIQIAKAQATFEEKLLALEQKAFFSTDDTVRNGYYMDKVNCYLEQPELSADLLLEIQRVDPEKIKTPEKKKEFFWNAALASHLLGNYYNAKTWFSRYLKSVPDTSLDAALAGILIHNTYDSSHVSAWIKFAASKDTAFKCFQCLNDLMKTTSKNKKFKTISSYVIPGSGSVMNGNVLLGATSLIIFSAGIVGIYALIIHEVYLNAALTVFPWAVKFYRGQIKLTKKLITAKDQKRKYKKAERCKEKFSPLLDKYEPRFK
jgi:hypothetical protein